MARSLRVQSQQLLMESQVLKDEVRMGAGSAEQPAEQMSERHDHVKNVTETSRVQLCAKSFILQVYDVSARHSPFRQKAVSVEYRMVVPASANARCTLTTFPSNSASICTILSR